MPDTDDARDATDVSLPTEAAEGDALDQATPVTSTNEGDEPAPPAFVRGIETPEADALDQAREVPLDDEPEP